MADQNQRTNVPGKIAVCFLAILGGCITPENFEPLPRRTIAYHRHENRPERPEISPRLRGKSSIRPPRELKPAPFPRAWVPAGGRISRRWTSVVIHHSATKRGGAAEFDRFHRERNGWDELGYHFVIGNGTSTPDGWVEVGPRWVKQKHGAHCKTSGNYYNEHGIGICLVGDFTRSRPTTNQLSALTRLLRFLSYYARIGPGQVTTHGAITGKTQCPGHHFPIAAVRRALTSRVTATDMPR